MSLLFFLVICLGVGFTGAGVTAHAIKNWYVFLNKPIGTPPDWLFAPVWTTLYIMMAVSVWRVWCKRKDVKVFTALPLFAAQLAVNALWTPVFFGMHNPSFGLVIILTLWLLIFLTIRSFSAIDKTASFLIYPYLVWVSYATWLNAGIWYLNK